MLAGKRSKIFIPLPPTIKVIFDLNAFWWTELKWNFKGGLWPSLARTFENYLAKYKRPVIQIRQRDIKICFKKREKEKTGKLYWPPLPLSEQDKLSWLVVEVKRSIALAWLHWVHDEDLPAHSCCRKHRDWECHLRTGDWWRRPGRAVLTVIITK